MPILLVFSVCSCRSTTGHSYLISASGDLLRASAGSTTVVAAGVDDDAATYDVFVEHDSGMAPMLVRERFGGDRQRWVLPITPDRKVHRAWALSIDMIGSLGQEAPNWRGCQFDIKPPVVLDARIWDVLSRMRCDEGTLQPPTRSSIAVAGSAVGHPVADWSQQSNTETGAVQLAYEHEGGGRYRSVGLLHDGRLVGKFRSAGAEFEREYPPPVSRSGQIVLLHQIESGAVTDVVGEPVAAERYCCNFVEASTGCLLGRRTGEFCGGSWAGDDQWLDPEERKVDMAAWRINAESVVQHGADRAPDPIWDYTNLLHCDPPRKANHDSYRVILEKNLFSLPEQDLRNGMRTLKLLDE